MMNTVTWFASTALRFAIWGLMATAILTLADRAAHSQEAKHPSPYSACMQAGTSDQVVESCTAMIKNISESAEYPADLKGSLLASAYRSRAGAYAFKKDFVHAVEDADLMVAALETKDTILESGMIRVIAGRIDDAIAIFTRLTTMAPVSAEVFYSRGLCFEKKGEYDRAVQDFDRALKIEQKPEYLEAKKRLKSMRSI